MKYHVKEFHPGRFHVVDENQLPIYDGAPFGKDRPVIFTDEDEAQDCADRINLDQPDPETVRHEEDLMAAEDKAKEAKLWAK